MSLIEILVIIFVGLAVIKPSDIPIIVRKIQEIRAYFVNIQSYIIDNTDKQIEIEQLNFYLQKIISIEGSYNGNYDLQTIKTKYNQLTESVINNNLVNENLTPDKL